MGCQQLVVRRGQPFTITLRFSGRSYEEGVDKLAFNVETGERHRAERPSSPAHEGAGPRDLPRGRGWCCAAFTAGREEKPETWLYSEIGKEAMKK